MIFFFFFFLCQVKKGGGPDLMNEMAMEKSCGLCILVQMCVRYLQREGG